MHKGARTKANMKKLMQEQHITTPNGQASDISSGSANAKEIVPESTDAVAEPTKKKESGAKTEKASKKKKSQSTGSVASSNDSQLPMSPINMDLTVDSTASANSAPRPGYTKSGKKIGRPRKDATSTSTTVKGKGKKETKSTAAKKSKKQTETEAPIQTMDMDNTKAVSVLDTSAAGTEINEHVVAQEKTKSKGKRKGVKSSRKQSTNLSSDASELPELVATPDHNDTSSIPSEQIPIADPVTVNEPKPVKSTSKKKGSKKSASKAVDNNINTDSSPDASILNTITGSKISTEVAQSVAESIIHPSTPISSTKAAKGKRKGKKSVSASPEAKLVASWRTKANSPKKKSAPVVVTKEIPISLEGGELPRLRSRSPKQRESPPLRISSPRAAKERSSTPATTPQTSSSSRSRASKEKETGIPMAVATPLSSPSLRTLNKSPEKDTEKVTGRGRSRQKTLETLEVQKDMLSPPPSKRSRQLSKESESSDVQRKGRHKPIANESRLSSDSDRSLSVGKRVSRRKSGSVSGSIDNLSSPSFNNHTSSSLSLIPSEGSLEMPSDLSVSTNADTSFPIQGQQQSPVAISPSLPTVSKGRKGKKAAKTKGKTQVQAVDNISGELTDCFPDPTAAAEIQTATINDYVPPVKAKKARKAPAKKGKRKGSTTTALAPVVSEIQVESNENSLVQVQNKVPVLKLRNRKGAAKSKKTKELPPGPTAQVLNIPAPAVLSVAKKNVKFKPAGKSRRRQTKNAGKKGAAKTEVAEIESFSAEYNQVAENCEEVKPEAPFLVDAPEPDAAPSKRRRSSSSATTSNTQVSAKLSTPNEAEVFKKVKLPPASSISPTATPKVTLRRDSRSISRDYDVSVVLTDIAQTFTEGDSSLLGISNSLSRLQSPPSSSTFIPVKSHEATDPASDEVRVEVPSSTVSPPEKSKSSSKKRKNQSQTKTEDELPVKKKSKKLEKEKHEGQQDRGAGFEAEIAKALLDLKEGTSKSPSPVKSIASVDLQEQSPKKNTKAHKRKKSPRHSIDNSAMNHTSLESLLTVDVDEPIPPPLSHPVLKVGKRKTSKARRNSKSKSKMLAVSLESESFNAVQPQQSLPASPNTGITSVKVAKTAVIPTASSLGISDQSVIATKRKPKGEKKTPKKGMPKEIISSPDITALTQIPVPPASAVTATKQPRKRTKKDKTASDSHNNTATTVISNNMHELESSQRFLAESLPLSSPVEEPSPKKKRQRKSKATSEIIITAAAVEPKPSTSAAALAAQSPPSSSSGKLFPYQNLPKPYKKPTVLAKPGSFAQPAKEDDNQKKKQDAPTLRVLGGLTKFYRGGEVEDVDPDPKLPKEKAQLQTDNAVPWICSFCHLGPHAQKLGDLFGPYFANLPSIYGKPSLKRETWMHGDCALWAGRLLLIGAYLRRLEATLSDADKETCTVCGKNGATIGCLRRGCKEAVHYPCAVRKVWKMDEQNFHSYCPQHNKS